MQTEIKSDYDAGLPGQLAVLPSFNSAAEVRSCRVEGTIYPGDALKPGSTTNSVMPWDSDADDPSVVTGVAVRSHINFPMRPTLGYGPGNNYPVDTNSPLGSCENGPIYVALKAGESPVYGDLAAPVGRNSSSNVMEWGVLTDGQTFAKFVTGVLPGNVAVIQVTNGALLGKQPAPVVNVTGVSVTPATATLAPDETTQLTATITPDNATDKTGAWSSDDETVVTVDETGLLTGVGAGSATVTFTTIDGAKTDSCTVDVVVSVTGVTVTPETASLAPAGTQQLTAAVSPSDATDKSGVWASDDDTIATVDTSGLVTAVAAGTASISFTTTDGAKTDACTVTVSGT